MNPEPIAIDTRTQEQENLEERARPEPRTVRIARRPRSHVFRILSGFAEGLITIGLIVLAFLAYENWGTSYLASRSQAHLRSVAASHGFAGYELPSQLFKPGGGGIGPVRQPRLGSALGVIKIPRMKLDMVFVQGADVASLRLGPGHYVSTPLPGQGGNVAIAGHRTTYLHPFWALNELRAGDKIILVTKNGVFVYRVIWQKIILPGETWVLGPTAEPSLTLTACHPRFYATNRIVVRAVQISGPGLLQQPPAST